MLAKASNIRRLLEVTARKQFVNGKPQQQVIGCVLRPWGGSTSMTEVCTTSLVRDGKTSIGQFSTVCDWKEGEDAIVIPDIERALGVLSAHGGDIQLTQDGGSLRIKSKNKQTTLVAEPGSLAFPHSQETIAQWEEKSLSLSEQINAEAGSYKMRDGSERRAFLMVETSASILHEALQADNMNSQKLNQYTFVYDGHNVLAVRTGTDLKGETETILNDDAQQEVEAFEATYEGGLEQVLSKYDGMVKLYFLDFRPEGQGIRLIVVFDNTDWIFQAAILKR
tara:strand:- start:51 stop:890 length:840 start_codon:yes stop_codon:yes gene_type:complete